MSYKTETHRIPRHAYALVLGACRCYVAWGGTAHAPLLWREEMALIYIAATRVLRGEEWAIPHMIRSVADRTPFARAPRELMRCYSECTYKTRKNRLTAAIAEELGILPPTWHNGA